MLFLNIIYVLVAIAMIALILMQRGAGAQAGSGFGGGASSTVFGARGSANFLSKSTKWLAVVFFGISLLMAWNISHSSRKPDAEGSSIMAQVPASPPPAAGGAVPTLPAGNGGIVPSAPSAPAGAATSAPATAAPAAPASNATTPKPAPTGG